jgi:hypothetical protein
VHIPTWPLARLNPVAAATAVASCRVRANLNAPFLAPSAIHGTFVPPSMLNTTGTPDRRISSGTASKPRMSAPVDRVSDLLTEGRHAGSVRHHVDT